MSDHQLTDVTGVASASEANLKEAGIEDVADLASATVEEVAAVDGFGETSAANVISNAGDLVGEGDSDDTETDADNSESKETEDAQDDESDVTDDTDNTGGSDGGDVTDDRDARYLTLQLDPAHYPHVLKAVLDEMVRMFQRNDAKAEGILRQISRELQHAFVDASKDVEAELEVRLKLTEEEARLLDQALTSIVNDYTRRSGITSLYGELAVVRDEVREFSKDF